MSVKAIFEAEVDGPSVVIWEAGTGTRITYYTEQQAIDVANYLIERANQYHAAIEENERTGNENRSMVTLIFYTKEYPDGEPKTAFQFIRWFVERAKQRFRVEEAVLRRLPTEFW